MLHLRYFVAVAEEGTFARAAQRLHMAASPLSQRIKYLENSLGTALFVRAHHHVDLTAAGHALLPQRAIWSNDSTPSHGSSNSPPPISPPLSMSVWPPTSPAN
ncbi:LysR family transcriptional regulator [Williamsia sp. D3]|uniref:LysR family transcriptional regulator n=1 Tax=Williamsia sp. D3 TaxID=1313067 RepID=UPI001F1EA47B|nr:LysR family transcriptional regulator [Williamsia sp. D3]